MNLRRAELVRRGQARKLKIHDEYTISCNSNISYMDFTPDHALATCTCVAYIFRQ